MTEPNKRSLSNTEGGDDNKLSGTHLEGTTQSPGGSRPALRKWRNRRQPLSLSIRYSGGSGCWYIVEARGREYRFTGDTSLHTAMERINGLNWRRS